jgi:hypothetical protein
MRLKVIKHGKERRHGIFPILLGRTIAGFGTGKTLNKIVKRHCIPNIAAIKSLKRWPMLKKLPGTVKEWKLNSVTDVTSNDILS